MKALNKYKTPLLVVCILVLVAIAAWQVFPPLVARVNAIHKQNELLDSIIQGDGVIAVDEGFAGISVDFYNSGGNEKRTKDISGYNETATEDTPSVIVFYDSVEAAGASDATHIPAEAAPVNTGTIAGIGVLTIESIEAKLPVTEGVTEAQLKVAVGHVPESAPIGDYGNAVIAGHRSYTYGHYFNRLGELEPGDIIKYQPKDGAEMSFEVYEILTVLPDDPAVYTDFPDEQILTLHTCTPVRVASHRLLVRAKKIS